MSACCIRPVELFFLCIGSFLHQTLTRCNVRDPNAVFHDAYSSHLPHWGCSHPSLPMQLTSSQQLSLMRADSIWPLETEEGESCFLSGLPSRM